MCVCVRACVRVCMFVLCASVRACVCVCLSALCVCAGGGGEGCNIMSIIIIMCEVLM